MVRSQDRDQVSVVG